MQSITYSQIVTTYYVVGTSSKTFSFTAVRISSLRRIGLNLEVFGIIWLPQNHKHNMKKISIKFISKSMPTLPIISSQTGSLLNINLFLSGLINSPILTTATHHQLKVSTHTSKGLLVAQLDPLEQ